MAISTYKYLKRVKDLPNEKWRNKLIYALIHRDKSIKIKIYCLEGPGGELTNATLDPYKLLDFAADKRWKRFNIISWVDSAINVGKKIRNGYIRNFTIDPATKRVILINYEEKTEDSA